MRAEFLELAEKWRVRILLGLVVALPIVFLRVLSDPFNVPKLAVLFAGVAMAAGLRAVELLQGVSFEGLKRLWIPATAVVGALLLSWIFSSYRGWSLIGEYNRLEGLLPYVAVVVFGVLVADGFVGRLRSLSWAFVVAGAITAAYGCLQYAHIDIFTWTAYGAEQHNATSTLGNPEFTGGFLSIVLPVAVVLCITERERRRISLVLAGIIAAGWLLSFSQGGWAAGIAGIALTGGFLVEQRWSWSRWLGAAIAVIVAIGVAGIIVISIAAPDTPHIPITVRYRGGWAREAARMGFDSPLVGTGPNTYALKGVHYRTLRDALDFGYSYPDDPHSVPMAFFANAGLLGLSAFLVVLGWVATRFPYVRGNALAAAFLGSAAAYLVQSLSSIDELTLRFSLWLALGGLAAALVASKDKPAAPPQSSGGKRKRPTKNRQQPIRYPAAVAAIALVVLPIVWWSASYVIADARFLQSTQLLARGKLDDAQEQYELAVGFRADPQYRRIFGMTLGGLLTQAGKVAAPVFPRVTSAFGYIRRTPDEAGLVEYGDILNSWAAVDPSARASAAKVYEQAVDLDPVNPQIRVHLAPIYIALDRYQDAVDVLRPITQTVARRFQETWGLRALAEAHLGYEDAARADADRGLALSPNDARVQEALRILGEGVN
ncbi:MAG: O-antigen ligase family protein [Actinomycetota bacterium]|nr:O-antigen ligase family protein [Actinomycetota bacterium]